MNQMVAHYQTKVRTFDVHFFFQFLHPTPIAKFVGGTYVDRIFWKRTPKKPITKHKLRPFIFIFYFIFTPYTHSQNVIICGQCFWKWTPKNPSPNKGNLTLDVRFCFNFYTPHLWPSCLGDKCQQPSFLMCRKKTFHQIG